MFYLLEAQSRGLFNLPVGNRASPTSQIAFIAYLEVKADGIRDGNGAAARWFDRLIVCQVSFPGHGFVRF
jgi:hypothetical protein